mmetsp:Transcript_30338/g.58312  ORF Transcript_30338/g.58312 Transcript_30338/m.58312 type:complete len:224 (+) Transcript_30338:87-758(+)|eukprot:CAMPEP_0114257644 /NCGR_PEP_ID=MMETSP0058-20121206/18849_1 /TAXON_ID=36894 /ORGANISM="Pyramimonas parkeae, CCMP726" /LENGTH=223 /DNA_ID=CAMNT_0001372397 /DNA_START=87 /DNA_END=758 /DNA_ORIENTATION=+
MNDSDYKRQIGQMVEFIKQEANEKANEIRVAADEEFNIQKLSLVEAEKVKIRKEYERKDGQVEIKKRIEYSTQLNEARLRLLQARDDLVSDTLKAAGSKLTEVSKDAKAYKKLLVNLTMQGILKLQSSKVTVRCRAADKSVCQSALDELKSNWEKLVPTMPCPTMSLDSTTHLPPGSGDGKTCAGGVLVIAENGTITCNNTLDARLATTFSANLPMIRQKLFA